jgi:hypothetical protein
VQNTERILHKISEGTYGNLAGDLKYNSCIYIA